ncbi:MAG: tetratricopeptide repeat protein [Armatimonadota bacterium]
MVPNEAHSHHLSFLPLIACMLLMAYPVVRLVWAYAEKAINLPELLIGSIVLVGLMGAVIESWETPWVLAFGGAFVAVCAAVPLLNRMAEKRLRRAMETEDVRACRRLLQLDPNNAAARSRLGDIHLEHGRVAEAIVEYEEALRLTPRDEGLRWRLARAVELKRRATAESVFCPRCDAENPKSATHCRRCGVVLCARRELWSHLRSGAGPEMLKWTALAAGAAMLTVLAFGEAPMFVIVLCGFVLMASGMAYLYLRMLRQ